jgi:PadR family transcriptional regulator PadR
VPMNPLPEQHATEKWAAQLRKGTLELAILASLWHSPRYGLDILQALDAAGLSIGEGTLYPILNRLRGDELLTSEWKQEGTGNPRKYYALTPLGRARTQSIAKEWQSFSSTMGRILQHVPLSGSQS